MKDLMDGTATLPPGASVFARMAEQEGGPPMMRMLILQGLFWVLGKFKIATNKVKVVVILAVVCIFIMKDFDNFFKTRNPNVYEQIGLKRSATVFEIENALQQYDLCMDGAEGCLDIDMAGPIFKLNQTDIQDIAYVLQKEKLRELYDKTELFIRKKYDPARVPSEGSRFFKAIGEISSYAMYIIIMFLFVENHQNFAKSMTISTLLVFSMTSVSLKMPQQEQEGWFFQTIGKISFLDSFCYFEINYIIKKVLYSNMFNSILHISRISDINPEIALKEQILNAQTELTRAMVMIELLVDSRSTIKPAIEAKDETQADEKKQDTGPNDTQLVPQETPVVAPEPETALVADSADLSKYGAARPDCLESFKFIVEKRKTDTIKYMQDYFLR